MGLGLVIDLGELAEELREEERNEIEIEIEMCWLWGSYRK